MGEFKVSDFSSFFRTGKSSFFISEKLAFQKIFRDGGTIKSNEIIAPAVRGVVNTLRENFLAGARWARNQNRCIRTRETLGLFDTLPDCGASPFDIVKGKAGDEFFT